MDDVNMCGKYSIDDGRVEQILALGPGIDQELVDRVRQADPHGVRLSDVLAAEALGRLVDGPGDPRIRMLMAEGRPLVLRSIAACDPREVEEAALSLLRRGILTLEVCAALRGVESKEALDSALLEYFERGDLVLADVALQSVSTSSMLVVPELLANRSEKLDRDASVVAVRVHALAAKLGSDWALTRLARQAALVSRDDELVSAYAYQQLCGLVRGVGDLGVAMCDLDDALLAQPRIPLKYEESTRTWVLGE